MDENKRLVLEKYPHAEAQYNKPVTGADLPHDRDGHWAIYQPHELGTKLLGRGGTEFAAWADAAADLRGDAG